jgi:hypothetical protein
MVFCVCAPATFPRLHLYHEGGGQKEHQDSADEKGLAASTWRSTLSLCDKAGSTAAGFAIGRFVSRVFTPLRTFSVSDFSLMRDLVCLAI